MSGKAVSGSSVFNFLRAVFVLIAAQRGVDPGAVESDAFPADLFIDSRSRKASSQCGLAACHARAPTPTPPKNNRGKGENRLSEKKRRSPAFWRQSYAEQARDTRWHTAKQNTKQQQQTKQKNSGAQFERFLRCQIPRSSRYVEDSATVGRDKTTVPSASRQCCVQLAAVRLDRALFPVVVDGASASPSSVRRRLSPSEPCQQDVRRSVRDSATVFFFREPRFKARAKWIAGRSVRIRRNAARC